VHLNIVLQESKEANTLEGQCKHCLDRQNQLNNTNSLVCCTPHPTLHYFLQFVYFQFVYVTFVLLRVPAFLLFLFFFSFQGTSEWVGMTSPSARCMDRKHKFRSSRLCDRGLPLRTQSPGLPSRSYTVEATGPYVDE